MLSLGIGSNKNVQSDSTMTQIFWTSFYDIEESLKIPYAHGISYYEVAIGKQ